MSRRLGALMVDEKTARPEWPRRFSSASDDQARVAFAAR
jgi:hypothetical protein